MDNKNNYVYVVLAGIAAYFLLRIKNNKGSIIVDSSQSIKPYAKAGTLLYGDDLNTPIYTFAIDTLIELLEKDQERGIVKIQFGSSVFGIITGFISQYKIIYK